MDASFTAEILQARVDQLETENKSLKAKLKNIYGNDDLAPYVAQDATGKRHCYLCIGENILKANKDAMLEKAALVAKTFIGCENIAAAIRELKTK